MCVPCFRRWFTVQNNQLVYRKRSKDSLTIMEEDLRLCTIKTGVDDNRRFCFEVLSPTRLVRIVFSFFPFFFPSLLGGGGGGGGVIYAFCSLT